MTTAKKIMYVQKPSDKVRIVEIGTTSCPPCVSNMRLLDSLQKEGKSFEVIEIAAEQVENMSSFMKQKNYTFHLAENSAEFLYWFRIQDIGVTMIIDRSGKVIHQETGFMTRQKLEKFLN